MTSVCVRSEPQTQAEWVCGTQAKPTPEILLVEDNPGDVWLLREAFRKSAFDCTLRVVVNGDEALLFLRRQGVYRGARRPDLVLLDLNLPGINGLEVLEKIKDAEGLRRIPVVVLTCSENPFDVEQAYRNYASGFVSKPGDPEGLVEVVAAIRRYWFQTVIPPGQGAGAALDPGGTGGSRLFR